MKYLRMIYAATLSILMAAYDRLIETLDRLPGFPNFLSVDYALVGLEKTAARLRAAQDLALQRCDAYDVLSDRYARLAEEAEAEADRAGRVQMRLSRLLD
jgi:hypothetical protein